MPHAMEPVDLVCQDGTHLKGHFLPAFGGEQSATERPVLLCPATGVKQQFYLRFAEWLARQGHDILVFDYRGIGQSLHGRLRDSRATLAQWGQQDQVAALTWLLQRTGAEQVMLLGHSAGGQMIGLLPNHRRVARVVGVAASTGWLRGMRPSFRAKAYFALRCAIPVAARIKGYAPTAALGLGENLPAGVGVQWGQWCAAGGYATNAVKGKPQEDFHHEVTTPITVLHATDDDIATPTTVADLLRTYPQARAQVHHVHPGDHGLRRIGHIDWFRVSHQALWPLMAKDLKG